jgi:glucan phosphoethanolaminetransferase (alkaline phosphatase superfamily)
MRKNCSNRNISYGQALLNILGGLVSFGIWRQLSSFNSLRLFQGLTILFGLLTLLLVRVFRKSWSEKVASAAFVVNLLPVMAMLWTAHEEMAGLARYWVPFQSHKLSMVSIALLAPFSVWLGATGIVTFAALAILQFELFSPAVRQWMPPGEPWSSLAVGIFASVILFVRIRDRKLQQEKARLAEQLKMNAMHMEALLAIQDLANTPIQTLLIDVELLKLQHPEARELAWRMGQSLQKMRDFSGQVAAELSRGRLK